MQDGRWRMISPNIRRAREPLDDEAMAVLRGALILLGRLHRAFAAAPMSQATHALPAGEMPKGQVCCRDAT